MNPVPGSSRAPARYFPLVIDFSIWDRAIDALARNRIPVLLDLVSSGAVLPLAPGTRFGIEADHATLVRVRVLDGPSRGSVGWLPSAMLGATAKAVAA